MIIKFTLAGLVLLLILILASSYYMNREGFEQAIGKGGTVVEVKSDAVAPPAKELKTDATTAPVHPIVPVHPPAAGPMSTSVTVSDQGFEAMEKNQRAALLRDIQKVIRNELISNRATQHVKKGGDSEEDCDDDEEEEDKGESDATHQGRDYKKNSHKKEDECSVNGKCDPLVDMTKFIRKDQIPCWGCNIDY